MPIKNISIKEFKKLHKKGEAVLVDVRELAERRAAAIDGSHHVPLGKLSKEKLPKNLAGKKLVFHCMRGGRGKQACEKLLNEDSSLTLYNLEGGLVAWQGAGEDVISTGKQILPLERQVQLTIGVIIVVSSLAAYFHDIRFALLSALIGTGLIFAGVTGFCGLARMLAKMPWNK